MTSFAKYKNPDKRCTYPFEDNFVGYCWSYANAVDKREDANCVGCGFYEGKEPIRIVCSCSNTVFRILYDEDGYIAQCTNCNIKRLLEVYK
jgi:hypothetical protein